MALRQAVASNVHIPDLSRMGYKLAGMHLYGKAAEILYRGPQDQLFTLYVRRSDGSARFDQFERRGLARLHLAGRPDHAPSWRAMFPPPPCSGWRRSVIPALPPNDGGAQRTERADRESGVNRVAGCGAVTL